MKEKLIKEKLKTVFVEILELKDFNENLDMENTPEWDSLKHLQLLVAIEKAFQLEIDFQESIKMTSFSRIVGILQTMLAPNNN